MQYETVAEAFRDLERAGGRLALRSSCCPAALLARTTGIAPQPFWLYQRARAASASSGSEHS